MNDIFIHPAAIVETQEVGAGTRVWAFTHIMAGVSIGQNCNIGEHCFLESGCQVGNNVTIKNGNMLWEGLTLADGVFVGPNVLFTNDRYPRSPRLAQASDRYTSHKWLVRTRVNEGASLGAGAVILAGATVGEFAMVGAGAVVTRPAPPHALVVGNPARVVGWVCQCGSPLEFQEAMSVCKECGRTFSLEGNCVRLVL